jgi:hypothetical protein
MCGVINKKAQVPGKAYWRKNNLPEGAAYWFKIIAAPCHCGQSWWVQPVNMLGWIEAEEEKSKGE